MSYIRELRPYMYWLGYLTESKQAGEMDWEAIGGTWGIATSRLADWTPDSRVPEIPGLRDVVDAIAGANRDNGKLLSTYVHKYFQDMWQHFTSLPRSLRPGAKVIYIIGNSTFYGVLVPAEEFFAEMLDCCGFTNVKVIRVRKRNSKKELFEYAVEADYKQSSGADSISRALAHGQLPLFLEK